MVTYPHAVLRLVWVACGPSLGCKVILVALGCSRTSPSRISEEGLIQLQAQTTHWLGPRDQRHEVRGVGGRPQRSAIRESPRQLNNSSGLGEPFATFHLPFVPGVGLSAQGPLCPHT